MLHSSTVVRASTISGLGLFAATDIDEGEVIWRDEPGEPRFSIDEIQRWPTDRQRRFHRYSYQVNEHWYAGSENGTPFDASYLMNHSCDPNTWFTDDRTGVARRRIRIGDENCQRTVRAGALTLR
jgi:SET domain-containing protein